MFSPYIITAIAFGTIGGATGATFVALTRLDSGDYVSFVANLIGGILGAAAAVAVWGLTYLHEQKKELDKLQKLKFAIYLESLPMVFMLVQEAACWDVKEENIFNIPVRIIDPIKMSVTEANLQNIINFEPQIIDAILTLRGYLAPLEKALSGYYNLREKLINETDENFKKFDAVNSLKKNVRNIHEQLMLCADCAKELVHRIDRDQKIYLHRKKHFSPEAWEKEEADLKTVYLKIEKFKKTMASQKTAAQ